MEFLVGPVPPTMRSANILSNHHLPASSVTRCLKFFGHIVRPNPSANHNLCAWQCPMPNEWSSPPWRRHYTWFQTVQSDLAPLSNRLATAYCRAQNRQVWRRPRPMVKPDDDDALLVSVCKNGSSGARNPLRLWATSYMR